MQGGFVNQKNPFRSARIPGREVIAFQSIASPLQGLFFMLGFLQVFSMDSSVPPPDRTPFFLVSFSGCGAVGLFFCSLGVCLFAVALRFALAPAGSEMWLYALRHEVKIGCFKGFFILPDLA